MFKSQRPSMGALFERNRRQLTNFLLRKVCPEDASDIL